MHTALHCCTRNLSQYQFFSLFACRPDFKLFSSPDDVTLSDIVEFIDVSLNHGNTIIVLMIVLVYSVHSVIHILNTIKNTK